MTTTIMNDMPLFLTSCHWIKWDLDPQAKLNFDSPKRGILFLTDDSLEFTGELKPLGGNLRATITTYLMTKIAGEYNFSLPLALICEIHANKSSFKFLSSHLEAVSLDILYRPVAGSQELKRVMAFPHFGPRPDEHQKNEVNFYLADKVKELYLPEEEAHNWERILEYQLHQLGK